MSPYYRRVGSELLDKSVRLRNGCEGSWVKVQEDGFEDLGRQVSEGGVFHAGRVVRGLWGEVNRRFQRRVES